jgi:hypothetical protein
MRSLFGTVGNGWEHVRAVPFVAKARFFFLGFSSARVELVPFPVVRWRLFVRLCGLLGVLCASVVNGFALDREAFTFTNYDLTLQIDPQQHRLGARGKITLRNDSQAPQKIAVLQISSSLDWRAITLTGKGEDKSLPFAKQLYTSDIDHTGGLTEAIVTLPLPVAPQATVELNIAYEGVILLDATRLTRIGTPEDAAKSSEWDQISPSFTAIRGAGYVAWYPIATDSANLSEGDSLFEVLGRWKAREAGSRMHLGLGILVSNFEFPPHSLPNILFNGVPCNVSYSDAHRMDADCQYQPLRLDAPTLVLAEYQTLEKPGVEVRFLQPDEAAAANFADSAERIVPFITDWFGPQRERARLADLPGDDDAPFESGALLLTSLKGTNPKVSGLAAAHQLTHAAFLSFRPWIEEGLAHFAQALYLERERGHQAALDYMALHASAFIAGEKTPQDATRSLVNTFNEELYRSKAMCVWWMLRDMLGDAALKKALAAYKPEDDKYPSYMQKLLEQASGRDLQWFFDDWVYHDRGLPDFKIDSVFPVKTPTDSYIVTVSVTNLGGAGAEVPIIVKSAAGDAIKRLEVRAKSKAVTRIEVAGTPREVMVNDGSVPETAKTNNVFKLESTTTGKTP